MVFRGVVWAGYLNLEIISIETDIHSGKIR
jgi:hypothetical protein